MSRPNTVYEKPEFPLVPDSHARPYANVDNQLLRYFRAGDDTHSVHPIVVPTALFTFMREVIKVDPSEEVHLYIAPEGEFFVFGMLWGERPDSVIDLWSYTAHNLPEFLKRGHRA